MASVQETRVAAMVGGRAGTDLRVPAVPVDRLRAIIVTNAALSELIMRSFILRRVRMISEGVSDLLLIGSRHSADQYHGAIEANLRVCCNPLVPPAIRPVAIQEPGRERRRGPLP